MVDDAVVGDAGARTAAYDAFSKLYKGGKESSGAATRLVNVGSPAARIYGYLILRHIAPADAQAVERTISGDEATVTVRNGCEAWQSTVGSLLKRLQKGDTIIELPKS